MVKSKRGKVGRQTSYCVESSYSLTISKTTFIQLYNIFPFFSNALGLFPERTIIANNDQLKWSSGKSSDHFAFNVNGSLIKKLKFGSQILGGQKNFLKIYCKKKIFKSSLQFSKKMLTTFFLVIENFFYKKCTLFIENVQIYFLFFVFFFLSLCFCFLSCLFFLNSFFFLKFSSDYWGGGKKRGFAPILIIGGACPGCPPRVYAYALTSMLITFV